MRSIRWQAEPGRTAAHCMVWLPGAYQELEDFLTAGFGVAVRQRRRALDLELVDLEPAHLGDRAPLLDLERTVLEPARARGVTTIWLGGISMGGYLALHAYAARPLAWDGLCLLAPYLGTRDLIARIGAAGLAAWRPDSLASASEEERIWHFVQSGALSARPCWLGFGREDRYAAAHRLLAGALPASAVRVVNGAHDVHTWRALWDLFLDARLC
jgi:pimeloyl-ACP methyl ester carboxylesterase